MTEPQERLPTKERLARALEALNDPKLEGIIQRARRGDYDDYESTLEMPQHALIIALTVVGHNDFAARVINGEFDGTKEEAEAWYEREGKHILMSDAEVRRAFIGITTQIKRRGKARSN